jgi:hypothetical protein
MRIEAEPVQQAAALRVWHDEFCARFGPVDQAFSLLIH